MTFKNLKLDDLRPDDPVRVARKCDPVGAVEIAARLGVARRTVDQWRQRYDSFPPPRWLVGGRPAWNFDEIEAWSKARADG